MNNLTIFLLNKEEIDSRVVTPYTVYISDSLNREVFYDDGNCVRQDITRNCIFFTDYDTLMKNPDKLYNVVSIDLSSNKLYGMIGENYREIITDEDLEEVITNIDIYKNAVFKKENRIAGVLTTEDQVLSDDGITVSDTIDPSRILSVVRVAFSYIRIEKATRTVRLKFPKENFDFQDGDMLVIMKNGVEFSSSRYVLNGNYLVLNDGEYDFPAGQMLTAIFYYKTNYDMNSLVKIGTQNIADGSITTEKLSPYLDFSADFVKETGERIFFTPEEKEKLLNIEPFATCYHHPDTHPAEMIVESDMRRFITKELLEKMLTSDNGYTKDQVDKMFDDIVGGAPELLRTLEAICDAFNDDENFATNMTTMINEKANKSDIVALQKDISGRVSKDDYVKGCVSGTVKHTRQKDNTDLYTMIVDDPELLDYRDLMCVILKVPQESENKGDSYLRINNLKSIRILDQDGLSILPGEFVGNGVYTLRYNGTNQTFMLQGKGGVNLRDTSLKEYRVEVGETVRKGKNIEILDDGNVCECRPHIVIRSMMDTSLPVFYCNRNLQICRDTDNSFLLAWKYNDELRIQCIKMDGINVDYVEYEDNINFDYISFTGCDKFSIARVGEGYLCTIQEGNNIRILHLETTDEADVVVKKDTYLAADNGPVENIYVIPINGFKAIVVWSDASSVNLNIFYISLYDRKYAVLSNRVNTSNYFTNKMCKVSDKQIVFARAVDNKIYTWVLIVDYSDFYITDTDNLLYTDSDEDNDISNLYMCRINDNKIYMSWTDTNVKVMYYCECDVNDKGEIMMGEVNLEQITPETYKPLSGHRQEMINDNYSFSVSNYSNDVPSSDGYKGYDSLKLSILKRCDPLKQTYYFTKMNTALSYDFCMLNDKRAIIAYNSKNINDVYRVNFIVSDIIYIPDGIAIQSGESGEEIRVREW